ncbi:TrmB family transcriptional regulator [Natrinema soli]|uniref:TrmB family transcriptional regulator n=1 Tax=Natrinema soli TaxID=1930624 RepID=A0ABD5SUP5_9EURY|nr:helix-turn-helix domain-containing protein [Natrinema soli]
MPTENQAVRLLDELGLTEYEARCFVALSRVQKASASEIHTLSDVPRSRVYDSVERLHRKGLVDIQQTEPRQYRALPRDTVLDRLREQYASTLEATDAALSKLRRAKGLEEQGAWAIADHDNVTDRTGLLLEDATNEIYVLIADEDMLDDELCDRLAAASESGVTVLIEVPSEETAARIRSHVPDAAVATTALAADPARLEGKWLSRILLVDRRAVLLSALSDGTRPSNTEETAICSEGPDHGLVVGIRQLLGTRLDRGAVFD